MWLGKNLSLNIKDLQRGWAPLQVIYGDQPKLISLHPSTHLERNETSPAKQVAVCLLVSRRTPEPFRLDISFEGAHTRRYKSS